MNPARKIVEGLLQSADVHIGRGNKGDIYVHDERFYLRVLLQGSLGLGNSYMAGWWTCADLEEFFFKILSARLDQKHVGFAQLVDSILSRFWNLQNARRAFIVGKEHYDLSPKLIWPMLGSSMAYSCSRKSMNSMSLDEGQFAKLDNVCRKLGVVPGDTLLDIGCGWGSLMNVAAREYGAICTGVTVSREQAEYGRSWCKGLPVEFNVSDYRSITGCYMHLASIGMFEHVGVKNYRTYFKTAARLLSDHPRSLFLLHTLATDVSTTTCDPWITRYIFPNGMLPSIAQISRAAEGFFVIEDVENIGAYYHPTLMAWFGNFVSVWPVLRKDFSSWYKGKLKDPEVFYRMWEYYLKSCAAASRARRIQVYQFVLSKRGYPGGYVRPG
ncbi:MAG TPA: cyclopropane fatty acyl phospholipid synthase [Candidatus Paceibacterota bacterium]|jgi:cyclopropane-fatty-acyl-phospholipid synthase|nr:cyclopropane fatty acyl phospholipid synthase [Candidatus Paceibacterota bacterium]